MVLSRATEQEVHCAFGKFGENEKFGKKVNWCAGK